MQKESLRFLLAVSANGIGKTKSRHAARLQPMAE